MEIRPEVRDEILALSPEDRHELADEIYESLVDEPLDPEWERAWSREIEQRIEDIVAGRVDLVDADEVHAVLRAELRDSSRLFVQRPARCPGQEKDGLRSLDLIDIAAGVAGIAGIEDREQAWQERCRIERGVQPAQRTRSADSQRR
jgi:putative addiction module component (TIGR02574 family)